MLSRDCTPAHWCSPDYRFFAGEPAETGTVEAPSAVDRSRLLAWGETRLSVRHYRLLLRYCRPRRRDAAMQPPADRTRPWMGPLYRLLPWLAPPPGPCWRVPGALRVEDGRCRPLCLSPLQRLGLRLRLGLGSEPGQGSAHGYQAHSRTGRSARPTALLIP